jgi:transcriptional regulator with XRE-family HTH domain
MNDETYESRLQRTKGSVVRPQTARILAKLGKDIEFARRVRNIPAEKFAQAAGISRATLHRLESGEPGISLNTLAMALTVLGNIELLGDLIDVRNDDIGLSILRQGVRRRTTLLDGPPEHHAPKQTLKDEPTIVDVVVKPGVDRSPAPATSRVKRVDTKTTAKKKVLAASATTTSQSGVTDQVVTQASERTKTFKRKPNASSGAITLILGGTPGNKGIRRAVRFGRPLRSPKATDSASEF